MKDFITGNVVKTKYNDLVIICDVYGDKDNPYYRWISFDSSNCSGVTRYKTEEQEEHCFDDCGYVCGDPDCDICHGTGLYTKTRYGFDKATFLADNVKSFILKRLVKNFEF